MQTQSKYNVSTILTNLSIYSKNLEKHKTFGI